MHRWQGGQGGSLEEGAQSRQLWDVKSDTGSGPGRQGSHGGPRTSPAHETRGQQEGRWEGVRGLWPPVPNP